VPTEKERGGNIASVAAQTDGHLAPRRTKGYQGAILKKKRGVKEMPKALIIWALGKRLSLLLVVETSALGKGRRKKKRTWRTRT